MRIGFVSPFYHPAMIGGIEWYLLHVTRLLAERGHDVTVYTTDADGMGGKLPVRDEVNGVNVRRFTTPLDASYRIKLWPALARVISECKDDVLHVFDYAQFHNLAVSLSRPRSSWSSVVTVYDIHSDIPRSRIKSGAMKVFDGRGAKLSLMGYDRILVRTPFQADFVKHLGFGEEIIEITPPGIDPMNFRDPPQDDIKMTRRKYAPGDEKLILYVGRLHPIKGIDILIKATSIMLRSGHKIKTIVAGPDAHGYLSQLEKLAEALGVAGDIEFTGYLDEGDKWILQSTCDVAVLPSSFEGFGQTLIQAMARGKPVIGTNVGGIPWVLDDGRAGILVQYGDEKVLAEAITRLISDKRLCEHFSIQGRSRAQEFSYPNLVDGLETIYNSLGTSQAR